MRGIFLGVPADGTPKKLPNVRRIEIIDHKVGGAGRVYSMRPCQIELSIQDEGRTLKVFVTDPPIGERNT